MTDEHKLRDIVSHFRINGTVSGIKPLGNGLINDTFKVETASASTPDYVLQRVNTDVFTDPELLMNNIGAVTRHIRSKLVAKGESDIGRKVLEFIPTADGRLYIRANDGNVWRIMIFIPDTVTLEAVTPDTSRDTGRAIGAFQSMLVDIPEQLGESIPDFHNMEFRLSQLHKAVEEDRCSRVAGVQDILDAIYADEQYMCLAERLYREGKLAKRICHCDTKVNNVLFDTDGSVLCVIDLDTVMPSFIFSDYGDFLRTGANFVAEDSPEIDKVGFNFEIFKSFTEGYLESAGNFLTPVEKENLPYAAAMFPFMQCVRFLWDYIQGDSYYKCAYPEHNLVRTRNQLALYNSVRASEEKMKDFIFNQKSKPADR